LHAAMLSGGSAQTAARPALSFVHPFGKVATV
jgi:hypothetical protein